MNQYETLRKGSVKDGINYLDHYINSVCNDPISAKSSYFYSNLSEIIYLIFGDEKEFGWLERSYLALLEAERYRNQTKFEEKLYEMHTLISLLSPKSQGQNLFTLLLESVGDHRYELNETKYPAYIRHIINLRIQDPILNEYKTFSKSLSGNHMKEFFTKLEIVLSPFDFYLFVFVYSIKKFKIKLDDYKYAKESEISNLVEQLCLNPYLILLRRYMHFFVNTTFHHTNKSYFKTISFLIEEYLINDTIKPTPHPITKVIPKEVLQPHIFHAVTIWTHYMNKLVRDGPEQGYIALLGMTQGNTNAKYSKLVYKFILYCLKIWNKDINNPSNLADIGYTWMSYIRFWSSLDVENYIDILNYKDESSFNTEDLMKYIDSFLHGSFKKDEKILNKKDNFHIVSGFIHSNMLFYIGLFKEFLTVFAESLSYDYRNMLFIRETMEFFFGDLSQKNDSDKIIYNLCESEFNFTSQGSKKKGDYYGMVKKHVNDLEGEYTDLTLKRDEALNDRLRKFLKKRVEIIQKFQRSHTKPEQKHIIEKFIENTDIIAAKINLQFQITELENYNQNHTDYGVQDRIRTSYATYRKIPSYDNRINDWLRRPGPNDIFEVYIIVYWFCKNFDKYILGKNTDVEDYCPVLPLRNVSKKENILALIILIVLLYFLVFSR